MPLFPVIFLYYCSDILIFTWLIGVGHLAQDKYMFITRENMLPSFHEQKMPDLSFGFY